MSFLNQIYYYETSLKNKSPVIDPQIFDNSIEIFLKNRWIIDAANGNLYKIFEKTYDELNSSTRIIIKLSNIYNYEEILN